MLNKNLNRNSVHIRLSHPCIENIFNCHIMLMFAFIKMFIAFTTIITNINTYISDVYKLANIVLKLWTVRRHFHLQKQQIIAAQQHLLRRNFSILVSVTLIMLTKSRYAWFSWETNDCILVYVSYLPKSVYSREMLSVTNLILRCYLPTHLATY